MPALPPADGPGVVGLEPLMFPLAPEPALPALPALEPPDWASARPAVPAMTVATSIVQKARIASPPFRLALRVNVKRSASFPGLKT
jgi:hypothetical protein